MKTEHQLDILIEQLIELTNKFDEVGISFKENNALPLISDLSDNNRQLTEKIDNTHQKIILGLRQLTDELRSGFKELSTLKNNDVIAILKELKKAIEKDDNVKILQSLKNLNEETKNTNTSLQDIKKVFKSDKDVNVEKKLDELITETKKNNIGESFEKVLKAKDNELKTFYEKIETLLKDLKSKQDTIYIGGGMKEKFNQLPDTLTPAGNLRVAIKEGGITQLQIRDNANVWRDIGYFTDNLNVPVQLQVDNIGLAKEGGHLLEIRDQVNRIPMYPATNEELQQVKSLLDIISGHTNRIPTSPATEEGNLFAIRTEAEAIKNNVSNLDQPLSTRASEATLQKIEELLTFIQTLTYKPTWVDPGTSRARVDILGGTLPAVATITTLNQLAGMGTNPIIPSIMDINWALTVRSRIT